MRRQELMERIERSWRELEGLVGPLDQRGLTGRTQNGWAVKDHLTHLAAWEESLLALLDGRDRLAALGLEPMREPGVDDVNQAIYERHREDAPEEAWRRLRESHGRLTERLGQLGEEDLLRPYAHYQPGATGPNAGHPVVAWIEGNTFEHFEEHLSWLRALPARTAEG